MIFKYKSFNNLLTELGRNDYVVEISELAIKDFIDQLENAENSKKLLAEKSNKFGIMVSYDSKNKLYNQIILAHIASVYHFTETFFYELQAEYNSYTSENWSFFQGKTKLDQILNFIKILDRNLNCNIDHLIDIFNYYHILRVYFSHKKTTSNVEINKKRDDAIKHFENNDTLLKKYKINNSPNKIEDLTFEDFFLFTQISKELSLILSSTLYPDYKGIAKMQEVKQLKRFKNKEKRIESYLKTNFGYICEYEIDKEFILNISKHL